MDLEHFVYITTVIIFAGGAVLIEWLLGFRSRKQFLKIILSIVAIVIVTTIIAEPIALKWQCWSYNPQRILNIFIGGAALETFIFSILAAIAIVSATLIWSSWEESNLPLIKTTLYKLRKRFKID